jgi:hypothetical protein
MLALIFSCLLGCGTPTTATYKLYPGPTRPVSEIAILELYNASSIVVDGMRVSHGDYSSVHLSPGGHNIQWTSVHGVSVLVESSGFAQGQSSHIVTLEKGHRYRLRSDRTTGHGYVIYHWIEDTDTGEVLGGHKKP